MLSAAERWVRDRGGRRMRMNVVNVRNALIAWYVRRGYRTTGVQLSLFPMATIVLERRFEMISASWSSKRI